MACVMPEPYKFSSLDSCQKMFLSTHKLDYLAPHPVVDLVPPVGDREKFLMHLVSKAWISLSELASRVHVSQP